MSNNDKQDCFIANKLKNYPIIPADPERIKTCKISMKQFCVQLHMKGVLL